MNKYHALLSKILSEGMDQENRKGTSELLSGNESVRFNLNT